MKNAKTAGFGDKSAKSGRIVATLFGQTTPNIYLGFRLRAINPSHCLRENKYPSSVLDMCKTFRCL